MKTVSFLLAPLVLAIACALGAGLLWGFGNPAELIVVAFAGGLCAAALALAAGGVRHSAWIGAGLFALAGLFMPASLLARILPDRGSDPFATSLGLTLVSILSVALIVAAMLFHLGLSLYRAWRHARAAGGEGIGAQHPHARRAAVAALVLGALLLAKALHNLYWLTVWDGTTDGLGYLWLVFPVLAALVSGVVLSIALPGKSKLVGPAYALLITAAVIAVSARAQRVDLSQLTEARAGRASRAIERYYAREGTYPPDLRQLIPRYVLSLPGPLIIYGQDWCYDGGADGYRLGYVYRAHWSDPRLIGRTYRATGNAPDPGPICDREIAALQER
jgi:hypothetical protein